MEASEAAVAPGREDFEPTDPIEEAPQPTVSLADELEADRKRLSEERTPLDLPLPGYGGKLVARYRVLDGSELKELATVQRQMALQRDKRAEIKSMCDTLSRACVGIFTPRGEDLAPLEDAGMAELEGIENPIRFDENLGKAVRYDAPAGVRFSVRTFIQALFVEDVALIGHFQEVDAWMTSARAEDGEAF